MESIQLIFFIIFGIVFVGVIIFNVFFVKRFTIDTFSLEPNEKILFEDENITVDLHSPSYRRSTKLIWSKVRFTTRRIIIGQRPWLQPKKYWVKAVIYYAGKPPSEEVSLGIRRGYGLYSADIPNIEFKQFEEKPFLSIPVTAENGAYDDTEIVKIHTSKVGEYEKHLKVTRSF